MPSHRRRATQTLSAPTLFFPLLAAAGQVYGATYSFASEPPQTSLLNNFEIAGNSYASAQQVRVSPARVSSGFVNTSSRCSWEHWIKYTSSTRPKTMPSRSTATQLGLPVGGQLPFG